MLRENVMNLVRNCIAFLLHVSYNKSTKQARYSAADAAPFLRDVAMYRMRIGGNTMKQIFKKAAAFLCSGMLLTGTAVQFPARSITASAASNTIYNDTFWKDTSGNFIYSQGGGVFQFGDTYYWYGVHYSGAETYAKSPTGKNSDTAFKSVTCYSSKDLVNWKFENDVLTSSTKNFGWAYWVGRMGVAYCKQSKKYVLVTQYNDSILFASCDSPTGNFKVETVQDQIDGVLKQGTGDQTVFVDDDGQAYIICSNKGGRGHQYVSRLRPSDFLYAEKATEVAKGSGREGNCLFKYKGKYYFCASDLHGWNSSHSYYMVADNLLGPYSGWKVMEGTDEDFSHVTQTGFFYTVKGTKQETVLFCGDRWSDFAGNGIGYNQWVPLTVNGNDVKFNSLSEWNLDAVTGEWSVGAGNNYCLNPSFEADRVSQTTLAGWKFSGTGNSNRKGGHTGNWCVQQYDANAFKATMTQDAAVPNGTYTLKAWVKSTGGQNSAMVYVRGYGGDDKIMNVNKKMDSWTQITIDNIAVTTGKVQIGVYSDAKAGNWLMVDDFTLIGDGAQPVVTPVEPIKYADGTYIKNLTVNDAENAADWSVQTEKQPGSNVFGDRAFTFTGEMPAVLNGAEWISTACDSKKYGDTEAQFTAGEDITAFIALDTRVTDVPAWLGDWKQTADTITDDGDPQVTYQLYRRDFAANETVTLGALAQANCVNYAVAVTAKQAEAVIGDINADGICSLTDVVMLQKFLLTDGTLTTEQAAVADMNADGKLNAIDLTLLKRLLIQ
jgi:hypothetical protein